MTNDRPDADDTAATLAALVDLLNATVFGIAMGALGFTKVKTSRVHYTNVALLA